MSFSMLSSLLFSSLLFSFSFSSYCECYNYDCCFHTSLSSIFHIPFGFFKGRTLLASCDQTSSHQTHCSLLHSSSFTLSSFFSHTAVMKYKPISSHMYLCPSPTAWCFCARTFIHYTAGTGHLDPFILCFIIGEI